MLAPPLRSTFDALLETYMVKLSAHFNKGCSKFTRYGQIHCTLQLSVQWVHQTWSNSMHTSIKCAVSLITWNFVNIYIYILYMYIYIIYYIYIVCMYIYIYIVCMCIYIYTYVSSCFHQHEDGDNHVHTRPGIAWSEQITGCLLLLQHLTSSHLLTSNQNYPKTRLNSIASRTRSQARSQKSLSKKLRVEMQWQSDSASASQQLPCPSALPLWLQNLQTYDCRKRNPRLLEACRQAWGVSKCVFQYMLTLAT